MAAQNITELSFQITADASGFYGELTRAATETEKYVQGITRAQQELGARRNDQGLLLNAQNEVIEGLRNWQIALGYTRDANGLLVNSNKQLIEGLSTVEQKMGHYKDSLDNVYNSEGSIIRQGAKAIAIQKEQAKAAQDLAKAIEAENIARERTIALEKESQAKAAAEANRAVQESLKGLGDTLKFTTNMMVTFSAGSGESAKRLKALSASMASFTSTTQMMPQMVKWYKSLTLATKGQTTAQVILNAVSGNWLTIAAGLTAAAGTFAFVSRMEQKANSVDNLTDSMRNLNQATSDYIKNEHDALYWNNIFNNNDTRDLSAAGMNQKEQRKAQDELKQFAVNIVNSELGRMRSESERIRDMITLIDENFREDDPQREKINKAIESLKKRESETLAKEQERMNQERERLLAPLQNYMTGVEKVTKQFEWMDKINDDQIKSSLAYQAAMADRAKQLGEAAIKDSLTDGQKKLYDQIQSYMSPWEQFSKTQKNLTALLEKQGLNLEGWLEASKKNEQALLAGSKYGSFLEQARENLIPFNEKLQSGVQEMTLLAKTLGYTKEELEAAKEKFKQSIDAEQQKPESTGRTELAAASKGSLEAYRIVNNNQQDKQVKAIKDFQRELIASEKENAELIAQTLTENTPWSEIGIV